MGKRFRNSEKRLCNPYVICIGRRAVCGSRSETTTWDDCVLPPEVMWGGGGGGGIQSATFILPRSSSGNGLVSLKMASRVALFASTLRRALLAVATRRPLLHVCRRSFNSQVSEGREVRANKRSKKKCIDLVSPGVHLWRLWGGARHKWRHPSRRKRK